MNKREFLDKLSKKLVGLPENDIEERISFYSEMIDDQMEEGLSEDEAILAVGPVDEIVAQILSDIPLSKIAKEKIKSKRQLNMLEIILLILGSPIWLSLSIAAIAVIISLYISLWAVIISLWAVFASLAACSFGGIVASVIFTACSNIPSGLVMLGAGLTCAGLSIFLFFGTKASSKAIVLLAGKIILSIKKMFIKKETKI